MTDNAKSLRVTVLYFMALFLRRHYPDQVLRVPKWISGPEATPVSE